MHLNNSSVNVHITRGETSRYTPTNINKTSVLFVSISFIVLMIISLAWLVFYYIQRFRYAHAKERLSRRLASAAKKAITKIPLRTVKNGDKETTPDFDPCAVCIEGYKTCDVVRILPCKHTFHKSCVDPWLLEQRSCPMCKMDILKAYGFHVNGSRESVNNHNNRSADPEGDPETANNTRTVTTPAPGTDHAGSVDENEDSDTNIQVLHLQPPDIECHENEEARSVRLLQNNDVMESTRSSESDCCNEMQSLMSSENQQSVSKV